MLIVQYHLSKEKVPVVSIYSQLCYDVHTSHMCIRLIRLDSPNLNYLIIFGTIVIFIGGVFFVMPVLSSSALPALCVVC